MPMAPDDRSRFEFPETHVSAPDDAPINEADRKAKGGVSENEASGAIRVSEDEVAMILATGKLEEKGLLPYSSNYTFLAIVRRAGRQVAAVYKPRRGENPLWDFPAGTLCQRETAAYEVSVALNWRLVPPTVLRDGPRGVGSVQFFVHCNPDIHYFNMREDARYAPALRRMALFDYIINNADRKAGHCLFDYDDRLWAIDHGICFHHEYKLRTVIWEFSGEPIHADFLADLARLRCQLDDPNSRLNVRLHELINARERRALCHRVERLLSFQSYPTPLAHQRNYPWPPI